MGRLRAIAQKRGGEVLSTEYVRSTSKMIFKCADGHEFSMIPASVWGSGTWCPNCQNKTESLVRRFFEYVFTAKFPHASPEWLLRASGRRAQLDGFSEDLGVAFEYHGKQHFVHLPHFHERGKNTLEEQVSRDNDVRSACARNGVLLIEIPYLENGYGQPEFVAHVRHFIEASTGKPLQENLVKKFEETPFGVNELASLQEIAAQRGGFCLSNKYAGASFKMRWRCAQGHEWEARASRIRGGAWCPGCSGRKVKSPASKLRDVAARLGGAVLSETVSDAWCSVRLSCSNGHQWETTPNSVLRGHQWCPLCGTKTREKLQAIRTQDEGLVRLQEIAASRGGSLLSTTYLKSSTKYEFACSEGHRWKATSNNIQRGSWCRKCYLEKRRSPAPTRSSELGKKSEKPATLPQQSRNNGPARQLATATRQAQQLQSLRGLATSRGGSLLSSTYTTSSAKYKFECGSGHQWEATANNIQQGRWCPECYHERTFSAILSERHDSRGKSCTEGMPQTKSDDSRRVLTFQKLQELVKSRGGKLLSTSYTKSSDKYDFECEKGHQWRAMANNVRQGTWCPLCAGRKSAQPIISEIS